MTNQFENSNKERKFGIWTLLFCWHLCIGNFSHQFDGNLKNVYDLRTWTMLMLTVGSTTTTKFNFQHDKKGQFIYLLTCLCVKCCMNVYLSVVYLSIHSHFACTTAQSLFCMSLCFANILSLYTHSFIYSLTLSWDLF